MVRSTLRARGGLVIAAMVAWVTGVALGAGVGVAPAAATEFETRFCSSRAWEHNQRKLLSTLCHEYDDGVLATIEERNQTRVSYLDIKLRAWMQVETPMPCMPGSGYTRLRNTSRVVRYYKRSAALGISFRIRPGCGYREHDASYVIARTRARQGPAQREEVYVSLDNRLNRNCQANKCWWNAGTPSGKPGQQPIHWCLDTCPRERCCVW